MTAARPPLLPRLSREIQKFREQSPNGYLSAEVIEHLGAIGYAEARERDLPEGMLGAYLGDPGCGCVGEYRPPMGAFGIAKRPGFENLVVQRRRFERTWPILTPALGAAKRGFMFPLPMRMTLSCSSTFVIERISSQTLRPQSRDRPVRDPRIPPRLMRATRQPALRAIPRKCESKDIHETNNGPTP
jgi:hypothetical protein